MEEVVVDASVVAKWYLVEPYREEALKLRDDYVSGYVSLVAPALLPFEVLNAIRYSKRKIEERQLVEISLSLLLYGIKLHHPTAEYFEEVARASLRNGITVYDAAYVALAKNKEIVLYTADEKLVEKLNDEYRKYVKHIREYDKGH